MKNFNDLFIFTSCILSVPMILSIRCCINRNCSLTKSCHSDVSHCKFIGIPSKNVTYAYLIRATDMKTDHFDCWPWSHEARLCPDTLGSCYSVYNHSSVKIFCCSGDICNNPRNLTCEMKNNDIAWNGSENQGDNFTEQIPQPPASENSSISITFIIIMVIVSISVAVLIVVRYTCQKSLNRMYYLISNRPILMNGGVSYTSDRRTSVTRVTSNGHYSAKQVDNSMSNELCNASEYFEKGDKLFVGKFGEVWRGHLKSEVTEITDEKIAIKIFRPRNESSWETELEMYRLVRNRCQKILTYIGCDKIMDNHEVLELWLVTQFINRGSLYDYLRVSTNARPTWSQVLSLCLDIATGLSYLHEDGIFQRQSSVYDKPSIAHRDLKSGNILIKDNWTACIADFGLAVSFRANTCPYDLLLQVGTQRYMAPELLEGSICFDRDSILAIDIYSMSLIFWEILSQCHYHESVPQYREPYELELGGRLSLDSLLSIVVTENKRPQMPTQCDGDERRLGLWRTIVECWDRDAGARLSASCVCERLTSLGVRSPGTVVSSVEAEPLL